MQKLIAILNVLIIGIFILLSDGCKPKDKNKDCHTNGTCPPEYYRIRMGEPKSYLWSLPGSYWIYKNTSTGDLDTQTCIGFYFDSLKVKGTQVNSSFITLEYDILERSIKSSFNNWIYHDQTSNFSPDAPSFNNGRTILRRSTDGPGNIAPFLHPFDINGGAGNGSSNTFCKGIDSSLTIQGKTYFNVAKFDIDKDDIWEEKLNCIRAHAIYYWAKDIGLIKREMQSCNYSWELIEYKIIK